MRIKGPGDVIFTCGLVVSNRLALLTWIVDRARENKMKISLLLKLFCRSPFTLRLMLLEMLTQKNPAQ